MVNYLEIAEEHFDKARQAIRDNSLSDQEDPQLAIGHALIAFLAIAFEVMEK